MSDGVPAETGKQARRSSRTGVLVRRWWIIAAIMVAAINLRPPVTSVGALLTELRRALDLPGIAVGALTTLPVVCLGVFAFLTPRLRGRLGDEGIILLALPLLLAGSLVRVGPVAATLFAGTVLVGAGIALANVVLPALVKREFPAHVPGVTAVYTTTLVLGASLGSGVAVPLEHALPGGWRAPLLVLAAPILVAFVVWFAVRRRLAGTAAAASGDDAAVALWRSPLAWQVTVFMGTQSLLAYVTFGWLPTVAASHGLSAAAAGLVLSVSALVQAAGSLALPLLVRTMRDQRLLTALVAVTTAAGFAGIIAAPTGQVWFWAVVLGLGQGAGFALALTLIGLRSGDAATASRLSSMAQGVGYLIAAIGPLLVGVVHGATGGWISVLAGLLAIGVVQAVAGLGAGRNLHITGE